MATAETPVAQTFFTRKRISSSNCARHGCNPFLHVCLQHDNSTSFVRPRWVCSWLLVVWCALCWRFYLSPPRAQHAVHRREGSEGKSSGGSIAGAWATREDLLETKKLLENQLKKASADERKMGIDLSALRKHIKEEIAEVDRRL
ncbi:unnamed protein product [Ectocarpus sp. 12 AP-2014]